MSDQPKYEERYCAYIDILGFKELIRSLDGGSISYEEMRDMLRDIHSPSMKHAEVEGSDLKIQSVSDAVCVSAHCSEGGIQHLCAVATQLCFNLLLRGFFVRGAIVRGRLYHDENAIFGEALVRAFGLEQDVVRYPRIMISSTVVNDMNAGTKTNIKQFIGYAQDGPRFLHVLKSIGLILDMEGDQRNQRVEYFNQMAVQIQRRLDEAFDSPRHFEKVRWFALYWNTQAMAVGGGLQTIKLYGADGERSFAV